MTEAGQGEDPLAACCEAIATELLGQATNIDVHASTGGNAVTEPVCEIADDLEDEPFAAKVERARYRPAAQSEDDLTKEVLGTLNATPEVMARKVHQGVASGSGEPDLDICYRGRCVKIELKVGGGTRKARPTPKQHRRLLQWQAAGALVGWATSMQEVEDILRHWDDPAYRYDGRAGAPTSAAPTPEDE